MDTFGLRIIASDKVFFNGRCKKLTIPAPDGEKGVLAPLLSVLRAWNQQKVK